ncbi:type IV secretory system conjugative DNA transfer family protein, partial [Hoeflea sp. EC-HK425]|uniref:type IV secretory system conjugative DNA transfer family protein n=1 Tax=Hoeflea sp. EC-HK425 TaxID=2038388 RepID=UPI00125FD72A
MPFNFAKAYPTHRYQDGDIFLGVDDDNHEIGVTLETNALTIGGSGAGKGAALLITNARRWPHSLVCIDPKGENTALTWEARRDMGQVVGALDPFHVAKDCEEIRVSINPLQGIREDDPRARATILAIANGLIVSHDPKHMEWTEGARKIWAGLIAYNASEAPAEYRTFKALRDMIMQPDTLADGSGGLYEDAQAMAASQAFGGLVRSAGIAIMTAIEKGKGMERDFLGLAQRATQWLDDPAIAAALGSSTFDLDDLLTGRATLYLVLPADDVSEYAGFLRLFIKSTLRTMGKQSTLSGADKAECLYLLDEFYSLGKLEEAQEATGRMRGYGVHLWPFVQNMGQISSLYGKDGVETFFTNSDCHLFLGNDQDHTALEYISNRIGKNTPEDIGETPPHRHTATKRNPDARSPFGYRPSGFPFETATERRSKIDTEDENARRATDALNAKNEADYQHKMRMVGQARLS